MYGACRATTKNAVFEAVMPIMATSTVVVWQVRHANNPGPRVQPRCHASARLYSKNRYQPAFSQIERCGDRKVLLGRATASGEVLIKNKRGTRERLIRNHKLRHWRSEIRERM